MADLKVDGNEVIVRLSALEAIMACRRELRLPVTALNMVHVEESPLAHPEAVDLAAEVAAVLLGRGPRPF